MTFEVLQFLSESEVRGSVSNKETRAVARVWVVWLGVVVGWDQLLGVSQQHITAGL